MFSNEERVYAYNLFSSRCYLEAVATLSNQQAQHLD